MASLPGSEGTGAAERKSADDHLGAQPERNSLSGIWGSEPFLPAMLSTTCWKEIIAESCGRKQEGSKSNSNILHLAS